MVESEDKFKFDPTQKYGLRILWEPIEKTKLEQQSDVLFKQFGVANRSQALKYVRQSIAEIIPRGFRSKVKIRSSVIMKNLREWRVFDWSYDPSS